MMKCDMCYDRSSVGLAPMCASVCPSDALWYGTQAEFEATRSGFLENRYRFGAQAITTAVFTVSDTPLGGPIEVIAEAPAAPWQDDPFALNDPIEGTSTL